LGEAESAGAMPAQFILKRNLVYSCLNVFILVIFNGEANPFRRSTMAQRVEDLTINYEEDGVVVVKELDKVVLSKGSWSTILYKYQQWEKNKNDYGPERYSIRRYRKIDDEYRQQAKFNISSKDQAQKLINALQTWIDGK
jgi:hypothetical protein